MFNEDIFKTGFSETAKYIKKLRAETIKAMNDTVRDFTVQGVAIVDENATIFVSPHEDISGQEAFDNVGEILTQGLNSTAQIVNRNPVAPFIEFGTGRVGEQSPHPRPELVGWEYYYDSGKKKVSKVTGEEGWYMPTDNYINPEDPYFKKGIPSMPFMYYGGNQIEREMEHWFRRNLTRRIGQ